MMARWLAFVIWGLVAAAAVGWSLRLFVPPRAAPLHTAAVDAGPPARADLTRLFGVDAPPPEVTEQAPRLDSRFRLVGVAAPRPNGAGGGLALIAVDGKPPRPFRVGALVEGDMVLHAVQARGATLGPRGGAVTVTLEIPALPPPATGTMPPADLRGGGAQPMVVPTGGATLAAPAAMPTAPLPVQQSPGGPGTEPTTPQLPQS